MRAWVDNMKVGGAKTPAELASLHGLPTQPFASWSSRRAFIVKHAQRKHPEHDLYEGKRSQRMVEAGSRDCAKYEAANAEANKKRKYVQPHRLSGTLAPQRGHD